MRRLQRITWTLLSAIDFQVFELLEAVAVAGATTQ